MPVPGEAIDMEDEPEPAETVKSMLDGMSLDALKELQIWRKKCLQAVKHLNPPASVPFEVRAVPAQVAEAIRAVLTDATDADGVKRAFDLTARDVEYKEPAAQIVSADAKMDAPNETLILAQELSRAADALYFGRGTKAEAVTPPPSYTINLTAQMPEVGAPAVTVNVPEQPAPNVNVTNEVQPADVQVGAPVVNVTNEVQPAAVNLPPRNVTVERDINGQIRRMKAE